MAQGDKHTPGGRLRELIDSTWNGTDKQFAEAVGIDPVTLSRLVNGRADLRKSPNLAAIAEALGTVEEAILYGDRPSDPSSGVLRERPAMEYGSGASAAEQLLAFLSERLGHRRIAGELTDKDLIAAAYTLARKHAFTQDDYQLLDRWRDQIIQGEKKG